MQVTENLSVWFQCVGTKNLVRSRRGAMGGTGSGVAMTVTLLNVLPGRGSVRWS